MLSHALRRDSVRTVFGALVRILYDDIGIIFNDECIIFDDKCVILGLHSMDRDWAGYVKGLLRTEMARKSITYEGLVERLAELGVKETVPNLRNKLSRGSFTAIFLVQCLRAMGVTSLRLDGDQ